MSGIRKMFEMANDDVLNLGLGQPDFQPPDDVIDAYRDAMKEGKHNGYGSTYGLGPLREALASHLNKYDPELTKDNILVSVGATQAFKNATETFIDDSSDVLYPEPGFVLYEPQIKLAGGNPVSYPVKQSKDFVPDVDELEERRTSKTKGIIVNSPGNPTGGVFPREDVKKISDWARENDLFILSDEVYEMMTYEEEHVSFLEEYENTVMVNSFSKTFAVTGWRIGYLATKEEWIKEIGKAQYYTVACPPNPTQHALLYAMENRMDFVQKMTDTFRKRRDIIVERLNEIPGFDCLKPKGAFYVFPSFDFDMTAEELAMELLDAGVLSSHGSAFGPTGEGHLRFSYANSTENIMEAMDLVEEAVADLPRR